MKTPITLAQANQSLILGALDDLQGWFDDQLARDERELERLVSELHTTDRPGGPDCSACHHRARCPIAKSKGL